MTEKHAAMAQIVTTLIDATRRPALMALASAVLRQWPEHASYLVKSFSDRNEDVMDFSDTLSDVVLRLANATPDGLRILCSDYRYLCEMIILPEEIYFRRHGRYRLSSFEEAEKECYSNSAFMARYMNGLLMSGICWSNHAHALNHYATEYLPLLPAGAEHLEIGPGHGILLLFAAKSPAIRSVVGWDVSSASLASARHMLDTMGVQGVTLRKQNLFEGSEERADGRFDSLVMSEVLEHLEDPFGALRAASKWLRPGGYAWINVPANSPAPDHLFLLERPEDLEKMISSVGMEVIGSQAYPMTGWTLEKARKSNLSVSCVVTARRPLAGGGASV